jgi:hypothetical protein
MSEESPFRVSKSSPGRERTGREPTGDGSKPMAARMAGFRAAMGSASRPGLAIAAAGLIAGLLLVVTEFSTITSVDVASGSCDVINDANPELADRCSLSGFERHGGAFILLGVLAGAMAWGAGIGGSRPAAAALIAIGVIVIALALALDLPESNETGALGRNFENAEAQKGPGLYLEIVAGGLAVLAGLMRLSRREEA